jgi:primosomal protein N' (replication factor Y)
MDRDTTRGKEGHEELFKKFKSHKADVLIGTQMIAKGLHFPSVTLVGILNADTSLHLPDLRAAETTFQLIVQIAGRAGRADLAGEVILQTFTPNHPLLRIAAAQDFDSFYKQEKEERKMFDFPPFCRLIKLVFKGEKQEETEQAALLVHQKLRDLSPPDTQFMAPTPAGHPKIKDLYRYQFVIKTKAIQAISTQISSIRTLVPKKISLLIDVDPITTFF